MFSATILAMAEPLHCERSCQPRSCHRRPEVEAYQLPEPTTVTLCLCSCGPKVAIALRLEDLYVGREDADGETLRSEGESCARRRTAV